MDINTNPAVTIATLSQTLTEAGYDAQLAGRVFVGGIGTDWDNLTSDERAARTVKAFCHALGRAGRCDGSHVTEDSEWLAEIATLRASCMDDIFEQFC